jgi:uncharacterized protein (TIGR00369 family)
MDLDDIRRLMETASPYNRFLGIRVETLGQGRALLWLTPRPEFVGDPRRGSIHGGVLSALADTAAGAAAWSTLEPLEDAVSTVDLRIDYLAPATVNDDLRAEAQVRRKGNRVCHAGVEITQGGTLIALGTGVFTIHRGLRG